MLQGMVIPAKVAGREAAVVRLLSEVAPQLTAPATQELRSEPAGQGDELPWMSW
jgi:hypothetical protein